MDVLIWMAWIFGSTLVALLPVAGFLHLVGRLGPTGKALSEWLCRAPGLDVVVGWFTVMPMIAGVVAGARQMGAAATGWGGSITGGLLGLVAAVAGQVATVCVWTIAHELAHRGSLKGPRIVTTLNRHVGPLRNHAAVWWTALAVPVFALVRLAEYIVYPPMVWLVRMPRYRAGDWVNVSRHKFSGLVGHDLIWCLYCDWMTGVWSLGTEMLRNVESFWCPIRFDSTKKCDNCKVDFPDIDGGWVHPSGTMADVEKVLDKAYSKDGPNAWFGHPVRRVPLTIGGKEAGSNTEGAERAQ